MKKSIITLFIIPVIATFILTLMSYKKPTKSMSFENTVCASGTIESAEFGTITATVCYTGPETGSALAAKHRAAIEKFRKEAQE